MNEYIGYNMWSSSYSNSIEGFGSHLDTCCRNYLTLTATCNCSCRVTSFSLLAYHFTTTMQATCTDTNSCMYSPISLWFQVIECSHAQEKERKAKLLPYIDELKQHLQQLQQIHDHICKKADEALSHASSLQWKHSVALISKLQYITPCSEPFVCSKLV